MAIETELVEAVLDQVGTAEGAIEAPLLQLAVQSVWDREQMAGFQLLHRSTVDALEGAERIVDTHLQDALRLLPANERTTAMDVFDHLVTPSGGTIAQSIPDLATRTMRSEEEIARVLERLDHERIVRAVTAPPGRDPCASEGLRSPLMCSRRKQPGRRYVTSAT